MFPIVLGEQRHINIVPYVPSLYVNIVAYADNYE